MMIALRILLFVLWAGIGAAITFATLQPLTPLAWGIYAASAAAGFGLYLLSGERRGEVLGIFAGPGVFLIGVAINDNHTLSTPPLLWGILMVVPVLAVYLMREHTEAQRRTASRK